MWSEMPQQESSQWAIRAERLGKCYRLYDQPSDRLKDLLWGRVRPYGRPFWALNEVSFEIGRGEVVGLVGRNGAGKSTLLQTVCQTLTPSCGQLEVHGRVAALLELGAGFNPEFSGIENARMNAAILGLSRAEVEHKLPEILDFADIGRFAHQAVKTYSSGMFMRLAFAVATSVDPDILVIDEALSVGDGAFARKSFDRIMQMKDAGKTILFCSHSLYQVQALCTRALWLEGGQLKMDGTPSDVTAAYQAQLNVDLGLANQGTSASPEQQARLQDLRSGARVVAAAAPGTGRIVDVQVTNGAQTIGAGGTLPADSGLTDVTLTLDFVIDPQLPPPSVGIGLNDANGLTLTASTTAIDKVSMRLTPDGRGRAVLCWPRLPLLKGRYSVTCLLITEDGVHPYDLVEQCFWLHVTQQGPEQGVVILPHQWRSAHAELGP